MMNVLSRAAVATAVVMPLMAANVMAQDHRAAIGAYGGGYWTTSLNREGGPEAIRLAPGWIAGLQGETWLGQGRLGLRANGAFSVRPFRMDGVDGRSVNVWFGDAGLLFRLLPVEPDRTFAPFVAAGGGVVHYNPAGPNDFILFPEGDVAWRTRPAVTSGALVLGLGTDVIVSPRVGLRFEAADHIAFRSPLFKISPHDRNPEIHNFRATAGVHALLGRLMEPRPVAVAMPAPEPPPPPPAPPMEERIAVCTVDPRSPGGIRMIDAVRLPSTGEMLVEVDGARVPIRTAVRRVPVARDAAWFAAGRPLVFDLPDVRIEFVTFGAPRVIEPAELAFLGTLDGMPVYTRRGVDVALRAAPGESLLHRLADPAAGAAFHEVETLYVPTDVIGCVFAPMQRSELVRKVRG